MKFQDLFVPKYQHSNPDVRIRAIGKMKDTKLLDLIREQDVDPEVREAAQLRLDGLTEKIQVEEQG